MSRTLIVISISIIHKLVRSLIFRFGSADIREMAAAAGFVSPRRGRLAKERRWCCIGRTRHLRRGISASASSLSSALDLGVPSDDEVLGYFVSHLYCSLDNDDANYGRDDLHNLSRQGKPLLVNYDLDALKGTGKFTREMLEKRAPTLWKVLYPC